MSYVPVGPGSDDDSAGALMELRDDRPTTPGEGDALLESAASGYGGTTSASVHSTGPGSIGSGTSNGSKRSSLTDVFRSEPRPTKRSIVLAPDNVALPPRTELLGSSKIAANARSEELRKTWSEDDREDKSPAKLKTMRSKRDLAHTLSEIEAEYREKTRTTFINDALTFAEGTIPQSMMVATVIGIVCGFVAWMYYVVLDTSLEFIWRELPERIVVDKWPEHLHVLWIPLVNFSMSLCCALSIKILGEPGDMAYTIQSVHDKGFKDTSHVIPMVAASLFTMLAGASMGPEAPMAAICAATAGLMSRKVFRQKSRNVVRKHTLMGVAGGLSAFFGAPLGGSVFALEALSRFGLEYFEHLIEAVFAGEVCVATFRKLAGLPLGQIWEIVPPSPSIPEAQPYMIILGGAIGVLGAFVAGAWANFHWRVMGLFGRLGLMDDENKFAVQRIMASAAVLSVIGMLVPHTMFWGEKEIGVIATISSSSELPHVWPMKGLIGFEMDSMVNCLIVGVCKLIAVTFTFAGGYRGGYIFPLFAAGAAFGRALCFVFPSLSPILSTLCFAASINVAITRTALSSTMVLAFLSGEQMALPAVLAASVVSLFLTGYMPFIKSQIARSDIDFSIYYEPQQPKIRESVSKGHKRARSAPMMDIVSERK